MMLPNHEYVYRALNSFLLPGLHPFVEQRFKCRYGEANARTELERAVRQCVQTQAGKDKVSLDIQALLAVLDREWPLLCRDFFKPNEYGRTVRSHIVELSSVRVCTSHIALDEPISDDDAARALDTIGRLLTAIGAINEAQEVRRLRHEMMLAWHNSRGEGTERSDSTVRAQEEPPRPPHKQRILEYLRKHPEGADDDQLAVALGITPRQQVNQICRQLAKDACIARIKRSQDRKIVNLYA